MERLFYHFTITPLLKGLPKLIAKIVNSGSRVMVVCSNEEQMLALDNELWTFSTKEFVPHDIASCEFPGLQPVLLTTNAKVNQNNADVLVLCDSMISHCLDFKKCIYVFYGNSDEENVISMMKEHRAHKKSSLWEQLSNGQWNNNTISQI